ncbi:MAG: hypothetical protein ACXW4T_06655, partial [Candidatus Limnocylindrales bacterium]
IVGLVVGAGLVWFVLLDARRREVDVDEAERPREAAWLSRTLAEEGHDVSPSAAERMLTLHRSYLEAPPPDDPRPEIRSHPRPDEMASEITDDDWIGAERAAREVDQ